MAEEKQSEKKESEYSSIPNPTVSKSKTQSVTYSAPESQSNKESSKEQ